MLERLRVLESAATLAPWIAGESGSVWTDGWERQLFRMAPANSYAAEDAEFTAAARNALPALLDIAQAADSLLYAADTSRDRGVLVMRWDALRRASARLREVERAPQGGDNQ